MILLELCDELLGIVPASHHVSLAVSSVRSKLSFAAPELEGMHWNLLIEMLNTIDPAEEWHQLTVDAFARASAKRTAETRAAKAIRP